MSPKDEMTLLAGLRVRREEQPRRRRRAEEKALVEHWNILCPPGTWVRYFPVWGRWQEYHLDRIDTAASVLPSGAAVLWLQTHTGCVSARHCEPVALTEVCNVAPRPSIGEHGQADASAVGERLETDARVIAAMRSRAEHGLADCQAGLAGDGDKVLDRLFPTGGPHGS